MRLRPGLVWLLLALLCPARAALAQYGGGGLTRLEARALSKYDQLSQTERDTLIARHAKDEEPADRLSAIELVQLAKKGSSSSSCLSLP